MIRTLLQICREELQKAGRAIASAYEIIREADERALACLITFLRGE